MAKSSRASSIAHSAACAASLATILSWTAPLCAHPQEGSGTAATFRARDASSGDPLLAGFRDPPAEARPRTWWHWMNGNVSEPGIVADLEWMHRVGLGGVQFFDAGGILAPYSFTTPRLVVGDRNWRSAVRLAAHTADRLGMEFGTAASSGWSETGGPWVTPAQAMKKLVWSELEVEHGRLPPGPLPLPPSATGPFQDSPAEQRRPNVKDFYRDAQVIAYPIPSAVGTPVPISVQTSSGTIEAGPLVDGSYARSQTVRSVEKGGSAWMVLDYGRPVTVRGLLLGLGGLGASGGAVKPTIDLSDDGSTWRSGTSLGGPADAVVKSYAFRPLTSRFFRITLPPPLSRPALQGMPSPPVGITRLQISEANLTPDALVDRFAEKAGFSEPIDYAQAPTRPIETRAAISRRRLVDLTSQLGHDGHLDWTPPPGRWRIVRFGYSLTGQVNAPAPSEATGLEVDKFSVAHTLSYLRTYLGGLTAATGPDLIGRRGLTNLVTDSWEAGVQNWTDDMPAEFQRLRGYAITPWLPVLTGRVVESAEASDRFLWDYRRTLMDLLARHYSVLHDELAARGMSLYSEAQGDTWRAIADGMEVKSKADIPMAEYWFRPFAAGPGQPSLKADMRESASVAHILGRPLVANESLTVFAPTSPWSQSPAQLKPVVDEILASGINRIVLHTSVHQPSTDRAPGLVLGPFGQFLNRNDTWAEQSRSFFSYIARSSFLLQQGQFVGDVAYFYGEEQPLAALFSEGYDDRTNRLRTGIPEGYGYDFINAELLSRATSVRDGRLVTKAGAEYRILFLDPRVRRMTLATLRRLSEIASAGATIVGVAPTEQLGLASEPRAFRKLVRDMWGSAKGAALPRTYGKGHVYGTSNLQQALVTEHLQPDVTVVPRDGVQSDVLALHRRLPDGSDIYFLSNQHDSTMNGEVAFRSVGRAPELWHADSGETEEAGYTRTADQTRIPLRLTPHEAVFVVFRKPASASARMVATPSSSTIGRLDQGWSIEFPKQSVAPAGPMPFKLGLWNKSPMEDVRHFSGTATYRIEFPAPITHPAGRRILLDLGSVHEIATIRLNGHVLPLLWKPPYLVDVTAALSTGPNHLEIDVTNLWANRLIGDAGKAPGAPKQTWTARDVKGAGFSAAWRPDAPLLPSGLEGPVTLLAVDPR